MQKQFDNWLAEQAEAQAQHHGMVLGDRVELADIRPAVREQIDTWLRLPAQLRLYTGLCTYQDTEDQDFAMLICVLFGVATHGWMLKVP